MHTNSHIEILGHFTYETQTSRDNQKFNLKSFTEIQENNTKIILDFESIVGLKPCTLYTFYSVHHPSALFLLYISSVLLGILITQTKNLFYALLSTLRLGTAQQCTRN